MILRDLIARIKATCPVFDGRVYGSAQLAEGLRQAENVPVPTAFVMIDGDSPGANQAEAGVIQSIEERWTIVVVVSNKDDMRGQFASDGMHEVRRQLVAALLGWENAPDRDETPAENTDADWGPVTYRGSVHLDMNAARLWHQFSFAHTIILAAGPTYETDPRLVPPADPSDPDSPGYRGPAMRGGPRLLSELEAFKDSGNQPVPITPVPAVVRPARPPKRPQRPPDYDKDPYGLGDEGPDDADT